MWSQAEVTAGLVGVEQAELSRDEAEEHSGLRHEEGAVRDRVCSRGGYTPAGFTVWLVLPAISWRVSGTAHSGLPNETPHFPPIFPCGNICFRILFGKAQFPGQCLAPVSEQV